MLKMQDFNVWVPLTKDEDFFKTNRHVASFHAIVSVTLKDFKRITDSNEHLWPRHKQTKWEPLFRRLGFKHVQIQKEGSYEINEQRCSLLWANFRESPSGCPQEIYKMQKTVRLCHWSRECARIGKIGKRSHWDDSSEESESDSESEEPHSDLSDPQLNLSPSLSIETSLSIAADELESTHASAAMADIDEESIHAEKETEVAGLMLVDVVGAEAEEMEGGGGEGGGGREEEEEGKAAKRQKVDAVATSPSLASPLTGSSFAHEAETLLERVQAGGKLTRGEQVHLLRLVETCKFENEDTPTQVLELFKVDRTVLARLRLAVKTDADIKARTQRFRAQLCSEIMDVIGVGENTATRLLRSRRHIFEGAAKKAKICASPKIGAEATMELMNTVKSSWSGN